MKRIDRVESMSIINHETGEVLSRSKKITKSFLVFSEDKNFVTIRFGDKFIALSKLKPIEFKIFFILSQYIIADGSNSVDFSRNVRAKICNQFGINIRTLRNTLTVFRRVDIIRDGENGIIYVTPEISYKGRATDLSKSIELYNEIGKERATAA